MTDTAWWRDAKLFGVSVDDSVMVQFTIVHAVRNAEALADELEDDEVSGS